MKNMIFFVMLPVCFAGCQLFNFPPIGPGSFPYPLTQQQAFDLLLDSLDNAGAADLDRVNAIRRYVAERIDLGDSQDSLNRNYHLQSWANTSPFTCMDGFANNTLTAACGFSSMILCRLYNYAGFEAYRYDMGYNDNDGGYPAPSHRTVLVNVGGQLIIQDPFYNMTVTDAAGAGKDFMEFLAEVKAGDFSNIVVDDAAVTSDLWLADVAQYYALQTQFGQLGNVVAVDTIGSRVLIRLQHDYNGLSSAAMQIVAPLLSADSLAVNYLSLWLKPLNVRDDTGVVNDSLTQAVMAIVL